MLQGPDQFNECNVCAKQPGMATLCAPCYENRAYITRLEGEVRDLKKKIKQQAFMTSEKYIEESREYLNDNVAPEFFGFVRDITANIVGPPEGAGEEEDFWAESLRVLKDITVKLYPCTIAYANRLRKNC